MRPGYEVVSGFSGEGSNLWSSGSSKMYNYNPFDGVMRCNAILKLLPSQIRIVLRRISA